jgi:hypothetical protein
MSLERLDDVTAFLRRHLAAEVEAGFPRVTRIPSAGAIRFLDYFATLTAADQDALLDANARASALIYFPPPLIADQLQAMLDTNPALAAHGKAMQSALFSMGLRYSGLSMRKAMQTDPMSIKMMAQTRSTLDFVPRDDLPPALVPDPDPMHLKPAKAPQLRKLINAAFPKLFATGKQKLIGGETEYTGVLQGTSIKVVISFHGMALQFLYGVTIPDETRRTFVWRTTYENLWAAGQGWDYVTEENAEASIGLLCENIELVVSLRNSVMGLM